MKKAHSLDIGDKVAIVSLSSGVLGEDFVKHELDLGLKRLEELGLVPVIMPNALKGIKYLAEHPEARVQDLKTALADGEIKGIICAIGGRDGYKTIPYFFEDKELIELVKNNPKVFLGYSDSTTHHLLMNMLGVNTFYGQAFLTDLAELGEDMLPYSKFWFLNLFLSQKEITLEPSEVWYDERTDFSPAAVGTPRNSHYEELGYVSLAQGGKAKGKLFGGCLEVIYNLICPEFEDEKQICASYNILPKSNEGKMLFIETSDERPTPEKFKIMIKALKEHEFFDGAAGILFGKPQNQEYMNEYMDIVREELADQRILFNLNYGHAFPHCIMPYNIETEVDFDNCTVKFTEEWFKEK